MSGAAGSKYGILQDGLPTNARDNVKQKLEPIAIPKEYTIIIHDANIEKPDNWRSVIIEGDCIAFWNGEKWFNCSTDIPEINWTPKWWADFPNI